MAKTCSGFDEEASKIIVEKAFDLLLSIDKQFRYKKTNYAFELACHCAENDNPTSLALVKKAHAEFLNSNIKNAINLTKHCSAEGLELAFLSPSVKCELKELSDQITKLNLY